MRRRDCTRIVLGTVAAWPFVVRAQDPRVRRIAVLMAIREDFEGQQRVAALRESLRGFGWSEDQNLRIEVHWLGGDADELKPKVQQVLAHLPDVIVVNGTPGLSAVRAINNSVPTVFVIVADPVGAGFVQTLSRPGGNITGFSTFEPEIGGKWLETLKEAAPHVRRVGVLTDPEFRGFSSLWLAIEALAPSFGVQTFLVPARNAIEIDNGIEVLAQQPDSALLVLPTTINSIQRERIISLAARYQLPAIYPFAFHARSGGLIAYGFDSVDLFRRAAPYVARILGGEKAGDLPVQAPTKFELVVNLKVARALGLVMPPALLARADEVIE